MQFLWIVSRKKIKLRKKMINDNSNCGSECGALVGRTFDPGSSAIFLDQVFTQRQAQAGSLLAVRAGACCFYANTKHVGEHVFRNPGPGIGGRYGNRCSTLSRRVCHWEPEVRCSPDLSAVSPTSVNWRGCHQRLKYWRVLS